MMQKMDAHRNHTNARSFKPYWHTTKMLVQTIQEERFHTNNTKEGRRFESCRKRHAYINHTGEGRSYKPRQYEHSYKANKKKHTYKNTKHLFKPCKTRKLIQTNKENRALTQSAKQGSSCKPYERSMFIHTVRKMHAHANHTKQERS